MEEAINYVVDGEKKKRGRKPKEDKVEIVVASGLTINTGDYENERPLISVKYMAQRADADEIHAQFSRTVNEVLNRIKADKIAARICKLKSNIRIYERFGKMYPSVTSIIGWNDDQTTDFKVPPEQLAQYCARGTVEHALFAHYLKTGEVADPSKLPECEVEYDVMMSGDLGLSIEGFNFVGFLEKYPINVKPDEIEVELFNDEHMYAGRCDFIGEYGGVRTLCDIKTGNIDQVKVFKQMAAYAKCVSGVEQIMCIPINDKTQQGFSKPHITTDIDRYFKLFIRDRENFRARFQL